MVDLQAWQVAQHFPRQTTSLGQAAFEAIAIALTLGVFLLWLWVASSWLWEQLESISIYLSLPGIYRSIYPERVSQLELGHELGSITCSEVCSWSWKALRCSAGCKIRMHWPGLQGSCTPI